MKLLDERYCRLCNATGNEDAALTVEELVEGWHWCPEGDGRPVGPGCPELERCTCRLRRPGLELKIGLREEETR